MSISGIGATASLTLLPEAHQNDGPNGFGNGSQVESLPPGAAKVLNDGLDAAKEAEEGNFVPGLLSLTQSVFQQVRMCGQMAESACKDTQPGEDKKASNNPTGMG